MLGSKRVKPLTFLLCKTEIKDTSNATGHE
jgi:hypothetical protein